MIIYNYNVKGVFIGQSVADKDPLSGGYLIPRGATTEEPPTPAENKIPVFVNGAWELQDDFRGTVYYDSEGSKHEIEKVGEKVPENTSLEPQPDWTYKLQNGVWVIDIHKLKSVKSSEILSARKADELAGVTIDGVRYAGDAENRQALDEAIRFAQKAGFTVFESWKDSDGIYHSNHPVTKVDEAVMAIAVQRSALIAKEGQKITVIQNATTEAELEVITW